MLKIKHANIVSKILIGLLILHALLYPDLTQYQEKGMKYRVIGYPIAALSIYIISKFAKNNRKSYPHDLDILLSGIILLDMSSNALGFYGSIEWWDDIMHLINCGLFTALFFMFLRHRITSKIVLIICVIGIISWLQIMWELVEYLTFVTTNGKEFPLAYRDTVGDFMFGQIGVALTTLILVELGYLRS